MAGPWRRSIITRCGLASIAGLAAIVPAVASAQGAAPAPTSAVLAAPSTGPSVVPPLSGRFDIGGRSLYLECRGTGAPTIVLDAGGGVGSSTWSTVLDPLAETTRVCVHDRANMGRSDRAPTPRCLADAASDLHALLASAGVAPPFVLVGHSIGGLDVRLYGATWPDEVAGLVLVDGTPVAYLEDFAAGSCGESGTPIPGESYNYEGIHVAGSDLAAVEAYLPDVPARILVAGGRGAQLDPGERLDEEWIVLHRALADAWPDARLVVAEGSGHFIHHERPELVIEAIEALIGEVRAHAGG